MIISKENLDLPLANVESDDSILIDSDDDFVSLGLPGNGAINDPYRIENKYFKNETYHTCIEISQTTKHFVIQNCYFEMARSCGILLENVATNTAIIRNNEFNDHDHVAIYIKESDYIKIENNTGKSNRVNIEAIDSYFPFIKNNSFYGGFSLLDSYKPIGFNFRRSHNASVINNTINNYEQCIYARNCSGFLIENNTCLYSRGEGSINLYLSTEMVIKRNLIFNNLFWSGIELSESDNCIIMYNTIYHCVAFGIVLGVSNNNSIHHNNILYNGITDQPQGFDNGINNVWYEASLEEGNYWSDWSGIGPYEIFGSVLPYNYDLYPLSNLSGLDISDLYLPNTTNDDIYEENDYLHSFAEIALSITHNLHYADIDIFRINLQNSWKYNFLLEFDYDVIDLDFYLLEELIHDDVFNILNESHSLHDNEEFTFIALEHGYYYLLIVSDLEHYKEIVPTNYQLTITAISKIPSQTVGSLFLLNWVTVFINIIIIIYFKKNVRKIRKSSLK